MPPNDEHDLAVPTQRVSSFEETCAVGSPAQALPPFVVAEEQAAKSTSALAKRIVWRGMPSV
jgi:hypothetical protein